MTTGEKEVVVDAPNGLRIIGTLEMCPCRSDIAEFRRLNDGTLDFSYSGNAEMFYDEQRTVERHHQRVFLDEEGNEWLESQLIVKEVRL